jgi:hypothetical protein
MCTYYLAARHSKTLGFASKNILYCTLSTVRLQILKLDQSMIRVMDSKLLIYKHKKKNLK